MNTNGFMRKWLGDMRDAQVGFDGGYCAVAPRIWHNRACGHAAWTDASIIVAYNMYKMYGDTELVREHYESMEAYMAAIARDRGANGPMPTYGDWLAYEPTDREYISLCYHAQNARMMAELSRAIGKGERAEHYAALLCEIKALFRERYIRVCNLTESSQTAYLLALGFDMIEESGVRAALTQGEGQGSITVYAYRLKDDGGVGWQPGMAYGFEFAHIVLPHGYIFGSNFSSSSSDPLEEAGAMAFDVGLNRGSGTDKGSSGGVGSIASITISALLPNASGVLQPKKIGSTADPTSDLR
jgi:hypothetical protein